LLFAYAQIVTTVNHMSRGVFVRRDCFSYRTQELPLFRREASVRGRPKYLFFFSFSIENSFDYYSNDDSNGDHSNAAAAAAAAADDDDYDDGDLL